MNGEGRGGGPVAIVGPGAVGTTLGILLHDAGVAIGPVVGRSLESARRCAGEIGAGDPGTGLDLASARTILIATPDGAVAAAARAIREGGAIRPGALVAHLSGFLSSEALAPLRPLGARVASFHPLRSFASPRAAAAAFPGTYCFLEGDDDAVGEVEGLVRLLGGVPVRLRRERKALYHAAASVASNFLVSLFAAARSLLDASGAGGEEGTRALAALVRGTIENLERLGVPAALTGPIERGDVDVVRGHLAAIGEVDRDLVELYRALARQTMRVAREKGSLTDEEAARLGRCLGG